MKQDNMTVEKAGETPESSRFLNNPPGLAKRADRQTAGWNHKDLSEDQIMGLRFSRAIAYAAGRYKMQVPPVCTTGWDAEAWQNWVQFDNPDLTGFLPYTK